MATFDNGESGSSVRTKINAVLQHADGTAGEIVFNDAGADVDFRVESDTNANALFVDGATGNVGVGTAGPAAKLHVVGNTYVQSGTLFIDAVTSYGGTTLALNGGSTSMTFLTNGSERMRLDASGNLGLGVTPSAWSITGNIEKAAGTVISSLGDNYFTRNAYYGSGGWLYSTTAAAGMYGQEGAAHKWYTAPSGTAGNAITFTQAMTLDASGNLLIGTATSGASKLRISGLPTSSAGLSAGDVWNDGGTLKIA